MFCKLNTSASPLHPTHNHPRTQKKRNAARWGNPGFGEYVVALAASADAALAAAPEEARAAAEAAVRRVLALELAFWDMAYAGAA